MALGSAYVNRHNVQISKTSIFGSTMTERRDARGVTISEVGL